MRILVLTSVYKDYSLGNRDTSTNIVNSFVHDWENQGHDVVVVHNSHCYPAAVHKIPARIKSKLAARMGFAIADYDAVREKTYDDGAKVFRLPIKKLVPHKTPSEKVIKLQIKKIVNMLDELNFVPEVITGHWASPQMELISELKKIYNCKTACVLHGTGYVSDPSFDSKKYLQGIDKLGCRSMAQAKQIQKLLQLEKSPFVCYSGVPDSYIEKCNLLNEKFRCINKWKITFVGRLVFYKNVDTVIKALAKIKNVDWEFNIVGDGAEKKALEELASSLEIEEKVHFWGKISRDEVMDILNETHIFVMISTNEIFGLVYLEAMASSCLTIASKNGGVDGIIVNEKNGFLCEEGNCTELEYIIKRIMDSDDKNIVSVVQNGYLTAHEYSDSKMAQRYLDSII